MTTGAEPRGGLDALVVDALASAFQEGSGGAAMPAPMPLPSPTQLPSPSNPFDLPTETVGAPDVSTLLATPQRAVSGDQAAVERLGRAGTRRDPVAALDPLPWGRDSVTYSTASVATGREAGLHWPELVAFRLSDDFPAGPFDPLSAGAHAADNALPGAFFPAAKPDFVPTLRSPVGVQQPGDMRPEQASGVPPWLATGDAPQQPSGVPSWLAPSAVVPPRATPSPNLPSTPEATAGVVPLPREELVSWLVGPAPTAPAAPRAAAVPNASTRTDVPTPTAPGTRSMGPGAVPTASVPPAATPAKPPDSLPFSASGAPPSPFAESTFPSWLAPSEPRPQAPVEGLPSWLDRDADVRPLVATPASGLEAHATRRAPSADPLDAWQARPTTHASTDARDAGKAARPAGRASRGLRDDFPALNQEVHGQPLVWLDSAATTQKPQCVIDAVAAFYAHDNSNVHRGAHELAARATDAYEAARGKVQRFLGARSAKEVVFTRGATEAINLVAQSWGRKNLRAGDVIVVSHLEHHSNIVPWLQLCEATGAVLRVAPVDDGGNVRLDAYEQLLDRRVKLVAFTQVSNAIGTVVPAAPMAAMAHRVGARVLVDGSQAVAHVPVDVQCLGADFYVFSGHKIYAPTGIGALYAREELLEEMPPWQGGGSMIEDVTFERVKYAPLPARFEAGTPHLSGAVGLGAALDYVERIGRPNMIAHEQHLLGELIAGLSTVPGLSFVGAPATRAALVSFVIPGLEPKAIGEHLNRHGIAVRSGHHCAQPILRRLGHEAAVRPSLGLYNDESDVARLVEALRRLTAGAKG